jgi:sugar phosphate permease
VSACGARGGNRREQRAREAERKLTFTMLLQYMSQLPDLPGSAAVSRLVKWQAFIFFITFANYLIMHFARKVYTNVKTELVLAGVDEVVLSQMDTAFMFAYAIGTFISGRIADIFPQNVVLGISLVGSTLCLGTLLYLVNIDIIHSSFSLGSFLFVSIQLIHGLFQSCGLPVNMALMGVWFSKKGRGLLFGFWTMNGNLGDIVAALSTAAIVSAGFSWQVALLIPMILSALWAVLNYLMVAGSPAQIGLKLDDDETASSGAEKSAEKGADGGADGGEGSTVGFMQALAIPGVARYALVYGFLKYVNYAMFFWLPFLLTSRFDTQTANVISSLYSVGLMFGGVFVGWLSDLFGGRRASVIGAAFVLLLPLLGSFAVYSDAMATWLLVALLTLLGVLVGGPNNMITSAVAADLSEHPSIGGSTRSLGTVVGIINGTGSLISAFGLMAIGPLKIWGGWAAVWYMLIMCILVSGTLLAPTILKELADVRLILN